MPRTFTSARDWRDFLTGKSEKPAGLRHCKDLMTLFKDRASEKVTVMENGRPATITAGEAFVRQVYLLAMQCNPMGIKLWLELKEIQRKAHQKRSASRTSHLLLPTDMTMEEWHATYTKDENGRVVTRDMETVRQILAKNKESIGKQG